MKKLLSVLVLFCTLLSGCSHSQTPHTVDPTKAPISTQEAVITQKPADNTFPTTAVPTAVVTEVPTPEPTEYVPQPNIIGRYTIRRVLSDFSEDRAWVKYYDPYGNDSNDYIGVIDKCGYILYYEPYLEDYNYAGREVSVTPFIDGYSCLRRDKQFVIVDTMGWILFDSKSAPEGTTYTYLGYGDGIFVITKKEAGFSEVTRHILNMDLSGTIVSEVDVSKEFIDSMVGDDLRRFDYLGEGVFICYYNDTIYNSKEQCVFEISGNLKYYPESGDIIIQTDWGRYSRFKYPYHRIKCSDLTSKEAFNQWLEKCDEYGFKIGCEYKKFGEGLISAYGGEGKAGIYNYFGELIAAYPEGWNIVQTSCFSGGYAHLIVRGADGHRYVTIVDRSGAVQYDPIKVTDWHPLSWHGYINVEIDGEEVILSPSGTITSIEEIKSLSQDYHIGGYSEMVSGFSKNSASFGYYSFTRIDGRVLDKVYLVSNYEEVEGMEIVDITPEPSITHEPSNPAEVTTVPKTYINPSSYIIEGKWMNTGNYTFGQVQAGAIVVFDGKNCNFYSPRDTYAFYKEGSDFKLSCTSILFSQTLTFTVKIIDSDHIDIFNGSNALELERVG